MTYLNKEEKMLTFIIGFIVGNVIGFFIMCLLDAAKKSDEYAEYEERNHSGESYVATVRDNSITQRKPANTEQSLCGSDRT